jgi:hypothetical protein
MEPCFKREELWVLVEEARKIYPIGVVEGLFNSEETAKLTGVLCPFCGQGTLKFEGHIGPLGEAMFRCGNCTFGTGIDDLTKKNRTEAVVPFINDLLLRHEMAKREMNRVEDLLEYLKP